MTYRVAGYTPKWHARPGEDVTIHASTLEPDVWVHALAVRGFIAGPEGWSSCPEMPCDTGPFPGADAPLATGSYFIARGCQPDVKSCALELSIQLQSPQSARSSIAVLAMRTADIALEVEQSGNLIVSWVDTESSVRWEAATHLRLPPLRWRQVRLAVQDDHLAVGIADPRRLASHPEAPNDLPQHGVWQWSTHTAIGLQAIGLDEVVIGARRDHTAPRGYRGDLDAKVEAPCLAAFQPGDAPTAEGVALTRWNLAPVALPDTVHDTAGIFIDGTLVNAPTRAVTGSRWRGRHTDFTEAPDEYAAVELHRDDLADAEWPVLTQFRVPADAGPGPITLVLSVDPQPQWADPQRWFPITVFVTGDRQSTADVALVLPTFSYRAYANNGFYEDADEAVYTTKRRTDSWHAYQYIEQRGLKSLYGQHPDGTGVHWTTVLRPQATLRPDWVSQLVGRPHQLSADLSILTWLSTTEVDFTVITDEQLHTEGIDVAGGARVLITGSHPEYATRELLDAYEDHLDRGGHLMYLGGNGFILRVTVPDERPWLTELRRGDNGGDIWASRPGEMLHQSDGRRGGMWRHIGRPPNLLTGVGYSAIGFSADGVYQAPAGLDLDRLPPNLAAELRRIGTNTYGLGGFEIDCYDTALGSDPDAVVLGRLVGVPDDYRPVNEYLQPATGLSDKPPIRGDLVWRRHHGGGQVFAVGSISWTRHFGEPDDPGRCRALTTAVLTDMLEEGSERTRA